MSEKSQADGKTPPTVPPAARQEQGTRSETRSAVRLTGTGPNGGSYRTVSGGTKARSSHHESGEHSSRRSAEAPSQTVGIRRIRMTISKIDPLSSMKLGFLLSFAFGLILVIAMALIWFVLDGMYVWSSLNDFLLTLNSKDLLELAQYLQFGRWMSFAVIVAIIDIALLTALSAIGAVIYNVCASLVGGVRLTVTDE